MQRPSQFTRSIHTSYAVEAEDENVKVNVIELMLLSVKRSTETMHVLCTNQNWNPYKNSFSY